MKSKICLFFSFFLMSSILFSQVVQQMGDFGYIDWTNGTVIAKGIAFGKSDEDDVTKRKLQAKRAAKSVAFRNLAEIINGVNITSRTVVKDFVTENDEIRMNLRSFIRGAVEREVKYLPDGSCEVSIEAPLDGRNGFTQMFLSSYQGPKVIDLNIVSPPKHIDSDIQPSSKSIKEEDIFKDTDEKAPSPFIENKKSKETKEEVKEEAAETREIKGIEEKEESEPEVMEVTGVVVDARGKKMIYSIFPQIYDESGNPVYTLSVAKSVKENGMASYVDDIEKSKNHKRVKVTPIFVTAEKVEGSTVFISSKDAKKLKQYNEKTGILNDCKVIFVVTD